MLKLKIWMVLLLGSSTNKKKTQYCIQNLRLKTLKIIQHKLKQSNSTVVILNSLRRDGEFRLTMSSILYMDDNFAIQGTKYL